MSTSPSKFLRSSLLAVALTAVAATGCRGGDDDNNNNVDGGGNTDGGGGGEEMTIQEVQDDALPVATPVRLEGVVVVAIDAFGGRTGAVYVMEPEGGPFSGVVVATQTAPSGVAVGDLVDVTGVKDEFALNADETGRTVTQIGGSPTITKVGTGTVPAPEVLDPWTLTDDTEAEKWEGVLVQFNDVKVEVTPYGVTQSDATLEEMLVTGPFRVQTALTEFPADYAWHDCLTSIVGIGDYFFDYKILPRTAADFGAAGDSCLAAEAVAVCDDGADNDHNGYMDCEDYGCYGVDGCGTDTTVVDVQNDTVPDDTTVNLSSVTVLAFDRDRDTIWVRDDALGIDTDHNGLQVRHFSPLGEIEAAITVGSRVDVTGIRRTSFASTVVSGAKITKVDDAGSTAARAVDVSNVDVADPAVGAAYEGQLISVSGDVTATDATAGETTLEIGANTIIINDTLFDYDDNLPAVGDTCDFTGIVLLWAANDGQGNYTPDYYYLAPREAGDVSCN